MEKHNSSPASELDNECVCVTPCFIICMQSVLLRRCRLTLGEVRGVVIDIREADVDHGGTSEPSPLSSHIFSFDHHLVVLPLLAVHVARAQCCPDHT